MKRLLLATALVVLATAAHAGNAETHKKCMKDAIASGFVTSAEAKRACNPANFMKPDELGWECDEHKMQTKTLLGGARFRRDAWCE